MSEEEEYAVEFEDEPGRWVPIAGEVYKSREKAEERSREAEKKLRVKTRVVPRTPIWDEWSFRNLMIRMGGTGPAIREMKKRGEAGAVAGWAIYKGHIKNLIRLSCGGGLEGEFAREPAYRTTMIRDMEAVGETELIDHIEALWRKYPEGIPTSEVLDLQDDWDASLERRIGRRIPRTPTDLTKEDIEESKSITRKLHVIEKKPPEEEIEELEKMKREIEERMERLKRELEK